MGQAIVDLPDPLQSESADVPEMGMLSADALANADELLSQLAGDEIDRLLAEADQGADPVVVPPPPAPVQVSAQNPPSAPTRSADRQAATDVGLDALFAELNVAAVEPSAEKPASRVVPAAPTASDTAQMQRELDELDKLLGVDAPPPAEASPPAKAVDAPPLPAPVTQIVTPAPDTEALGVDTVLAVAERRALTLPTEDLELESEPQADVSSLLAGEDIDDERVPLIVRILEFVNAPMMLFPEAVRDALGKVALLTFFNATAVLVYVLIFRHPHR